MKTLYLECGMGAAGDMLTAALYELLDEKDKQDFIEEMNNLGIPGVTIVAEKKRKCGIVGTYMRVQVNGIEEGMLEYSQELEHSPEHIHNHEPEHLHIHKHSHHHTGMNEIQQIIDSLTLSQNIQKDVKSVYSLIAEAESHVHDIPVTDIHFHEVGTMDAIADVTAVCILMEKLEIEKVIASPVHVGSGYVHCAHGILPVPAPATAYILREIPIYGGSIKEELCTPTGAALLKYFVSQFGEMPVIKIEKIGYGMGNKDFTTVNCVRAILGETEDSDGEIIELSCNVDDMTPECIGYAMDRLLEANALEVYTVPIGMKKCRPGILLCVMCKEETKEKMIHLIFQHTTTIGIRENRNKRHTLVRHIEPIKTSIGEVRVKRSKGYGVVREKFEYDDLSRIATEKGISIAEVLKKIEQESK